jgi:uncharacterized protein YqiB (DUF1249 family)
MQMTPFCIRTYPPLKKRKMFSYTLEAVLYHDACISEAQASEQTDELNIRFNLLNIALRNKLRVFHNHIIEKACV